MEREGQVTKPLLKRCTDAISNNDDNSDGGGDDAPLKATSGVTALLVLSTIVAASGTFSSGYAVGFSSPAEPGIIAALGLSVAEVKNGREKEFEAALRRLRGEKVDISEEAKDYTENLQLMSEDKILDLFQRKYAHSIIVGVGLMVLQQFGGISGIRFYMSSIFELASISTRVGFMVVAVVKILMNFLGIILIDKFGRRPLLLVSATGTCLATFLTGLSFFLQDLNWWEEMTPILALTGLLVYMGTFSLGMGGIPWIIVSEIFPINVKGSAGSICNLVNWFCSWVVSYTFNFLLEWSSAGTFFIFSIISCSGVLFIAKLVPETKGRTLEEIQASMTHGL